jgi:tetratricopeptide (TPR) repeat protein
MESVEKTYQRLMAPDGFATLDTEEKLLRLATLVDLSGDMARKAGIARGLEVCAELDGQNLRSEQQGLLHYFAGNAWNHLRVMAASNDPWVQPELDHEILELRRAVKHSERLPTVRRCQIYTNLGNALSRCGRFLDAIFAWDQALTLEPSFGMAVGNRAVELSWYAQLLWHRHDQIVLFQESYAELKRALKLPLEGKASQGFLSRKKWIDNNISRVLLRARHSLEDRNLGATLQERRYRRWCFTNRLFLNPTNDLGPHAIAASDSVTLPSIKGTIGEGPSHVGFFNSMKQEFAAARYFLFAGMEATKVHFSDRRVLLANTLDYPSYCLSTEQIKIAFRLAYSTLDKTAYFLNDYLGLGVPKDQVTFRTLWYEPKDKTLPGKQKPAFRANLQPFVHSPLQALFWLSKDLYEYDSGLPSSLEPQARDLVNTRNHLEHKYFKVHLDEWQGPVTPQSGWKDSFPDTLAFSVRRGDLVQKTIRLLQFARAALIYLACTVRMHGKRTFGNVEARLTLPEWSDNWKR